jgi:hypothetical protein
MAARGAEYVHVCYILSGKNYCQTLHRSDAYRLRNFLVQHGGTIYWFNPG